MIFINKHEQITIEKNSSWACKGKSKIRNLYTNTKNHYENFLEVPHLKPQCKQCDKTVI